MRCKNWPLFDEVMKKFWWSTFFTHGVVRVLKCARNYFNWTILVHCQR